MPSVKNTGKPCAGKLHARFDEGGQVRACSLLYPLIFLAAASLCWVALPVQAASFNCAKAATKVEHIICDNPEISKLDDGLSTAYKTAVQDKQKADAIKQVQKQWMKERNGCADVGCVKRAYEVRLAALPPSDVEYASQGTSVMSEKAKGEMVSKILSESEAALRAGPYGEEDKKFCNTLLDDFRQQRGIEYTEPVLRTADYNHPAFVKLRNQCPKLYWSEPDKCDEVSLAFWLKGYEGNKEGATKKAQEMCNSQFGIGEYALYEFDFGDHKEHGVFWTRAPNITPGELEQLLRRPSKKEQWGDENIWIRRTNKVLNVFFAPAGYNALDFAQCKYNIIGPLGTGGVSSPLNHLGLIKYAGKYYAYNLVRRDRDSREYGFVVGGRNPVCHFDVIQIDGVRLL